MAAILGNGVYSFREAARLVGLNPSRVRAWFRGAAGASTPVMRTDYAQLARPGGLISFLDLVDTLVVGRLRQAGVPLQYLRKAHTALLAEFEVRHPFCRKNLLTDGKRVFIHVANLLGEEHLKELLSGQYAFPRILLGVLKKIDYDSTSLLARRWNVARGVVIDPRRHFGKPIVESVGIPTTVLAAAYLANDRDASVVADWYGVSEGDVSTGVAFEEQLDGAAA